MILTLLLASNAYAVVIGYNGAPAGREQELATLRYADDDALRYEAHFSTFAKTWLLATLDEDTQKREPTVAERTLTPSWTVLDRVLQDIATRMREELSYGEEPVFYFAYSGHGALDDKGNYALTLDRGTISQQALYERIVAVVPAKYHHLIVDACHAEAIVGSRGTFDKEKNARVKPAEAFDAPSYRKRFPSVGTIVGTTIDQQTHEWSRIQSGVFTHAVLSGLLGAADVNADGRVEYSEVHAFVSAATRTFADPRNKPQVIALPPAANVHAPLVDRQNVRKSFVLSGVAQALGHFYIELANGRRLLDANVASDIFLRLLLPADTVAYLKTETSEAVIDTRKRNSADLNELRMSPRSTESRGSLETDYRTALFAAPYSVSYYRGFVDSTGAASVDLDRPRDMAVAAPPVSLERNPFPASAPVWLKPVSYDAKAERKRVRRNAGIASFLTSAIFGGLTVLGGVGMSNSEKEFDATDKQRQANAAADRYEIYRVVLIGSAILAVGGALAGLILVSD